MCLLPWTVLLPEHSSFGRTSLVRGSVSVLGNGRVGVHLAGLTLLSGGVARNKTIERWPSVRPA